MDIKTIKIKEGLNLKVPRCMIASPTLENLADYSKLPETIAVFTEHQKLITPLVKKDERVKKNTALFSLLEDKNIKFLSPLSGKIKDFILDGRKRIGLIIEVDTSYDYKKESNNLEKIELPSKLTPESVRDTLLNSGLWTFLRQRPYSKIPLSRAQCSSICITAMDQDILPLDIAFIVSKYDRADYAMGVKILSYLTPSIHLCTNQLTFLKLKQMLSFCDEKVRLFEGLFPSSLVGTHIHHLDPVYPKKEKLPWYIDIQDVIRIGKFFNTQQLDYSKIIALSGDLPCPTHLRVIQGTSINSIIDSGLIPKDVDKTNIIIGSYLNGKILDESLSSSFYLGRYDSKISIASQDQPGSLFCWARPEPRFYSFYNTVISKFIKSKFKFSRKAHGSLRPVFPLESFEKVFPFKTSALFLLKSLLIKDSELSVKLGCLELDEEDMGLCSFICPSKHDWGSILREELNLLEEEEEKSRV